MRTITWFCSRQTYKAMRNEDYHLVLRKANLQSNEKWGLSPGFAAGKPTKQWEMRTITLFCGRQTYKAMRNEDYHLVLRKANLQSNEKWGLSPCTAKYQSAEEQRIVLYKTDQQQPVLHCNPLAWKADSKPRLKAYLLIVHPVDLLLRQPGCLSLAIVSEQVFLHQ